MIWLIFLISCVSSQDLVPFPRRSCFQGWKDYDNYDIFGYDMGFEVATDPQQCFSICDNVSNCRGFTYGAAFVGHRCYLKSRGATEVYHNPDVYSGYKCDPVVHHEKEIYEKWWFYVAICSGLLLICCILTLIYYIRYAVVTANEVKKQNEWQDRFKQQIEIRQNCEGA